MTPTEQAQQIVNQYYMILFDSESDKGQEILISILARKCAIRDVQNTIAANPHENPFNSSAGSTIMYWMEVLTEINKIMKKTKAYFMQHCDNEECDLGSLEYDCPICNRAGIDYDLWWKRFDISGGKPEIFECENCGKSLIIKYSKKNSEYIVQSNN